ncbi:hypothetical protein [Porphyromonas circumdentaria]|nr:hypothetical protein [Porphyromonas circumdentaria]MBB6275818.1 hypothetical protein [Porphyromonas circumdentaria]MDO4721677.1 hypothetical protein [Porphyromonas circumdentaria]
MEQSGAASYSSYCSTFLTPRTILSIPDVLFFWSQGTSALDAGP